MSTKYVIVEVGGVETPIIFSHMIAHSDMKELFGNNIISAGFFEVAAKPSEKDANDIEVGAYGRSTTLKLQSRKDIDSKLIKELLRRSY